MGLAGVRWMVVREPKNKKRKRRKITAGERKWRWAMGYIRPNKCKDVKARTIRDTCRGRSGGHLAGAAAPTAAHAARVTNWTLPLATER